MSTQQPLVQQPTTAAVAQAMKMRRAAFKCDVFYGASGTTKTTNIGRAALYYHRKSGGKKCRLVWADPGGYDPIASLVDEGIMDVWVVANARMPIEALVKATQGYWPKDTSDPESPLALPRDTDWNGVCYYAFEGLTSMGDMILRKLRSTGASLSQDPNFRWSESDGSLMFFGSNQTYYGFVQDRLYEAVVTSGLLPVEKVGWTALEARGEDGGVPIYGPSIAGKKSTPKAPQWFGNCLHFEMITAIDPEKRDAAGQATVLTKPVMYLWPHADPLTHVMFPAKTRCPFQYVGELKQWANQQPWVEPEIEKLYAKLDELRVRAGEELRK